MSTSNTRPSFICKHQESVLALTIWKLGAFNRNSPGPYASMAEFWPDIRDVSVPSPALEPHAKAISHKAGEEPRDERVSLALQMLIGYELDNRRRILAVKSRLRLLVALPQVTTVNGCTGLRIDEWRSRGNGSWAHDRRSHTSTCTGCQTGSVTALVQDHHRSLDLQDFRDHTIDQIYNQSAFQQVSLNRSDCQHRNSRSFATTINADRERRQKNKICGGHDRQCKQK